MLVLKKDGEYVERVVVCDGVAQIHLTSNKEKSQLFLEEEKPSLQRICDMTGLEIDNAWEEIQ